MRQLIILVYVAVFAQLGSAQAAKYKAVMIPVRDGRSLAADLYISDSSIKKPTILIQTPYNKNLFRLAVILPQGGGVGLPYDSLKYNYVIVDWRGFFGSKDAGIGKPTYDRGIDGFDIVEWIAAQPWSNGKIGTWGGSALGLIQFQTAKHHPPHLVCAMPFIIDYKSEYQKYFPGGVFLREHYEMVESLGLISTTLILQHPTYDIYWKTAEQLTDYPDSINVPLLMLTGWYDHFPDGVIRAYEDLRKRSHGDVRDKHKLVIGPWLHTKVGVAEQGILAYPEAAGVPTDLAFQFFGFYLLGEETAWEASPAVRYFDIGSHQWNFADLWSDVAGTSKVLRLYMTTANRLDETLPLSPGVVSYHYDPRHPSPSIGSSTFNDTLLHGPQDISNSIEIRDDIAIFSTETLNKDIVVRGAVKVKLIVKAATNLDTDFGVRLCDVFPDGRSVIITDAIRRLRFRNGFEVEELATPGTIYPIEIELRNLAMTFLKGHKLRIDITSSNFPRFDLNLNTGGALYQPGDTFTVSPSIYLGGANASLIEIPVASPLGVATGSEPAFTASPNPCGEQTRLYCNAEKVGKICWDLYDGIGRIVRSGSAWLTTGANNVDVSLAGLPQGQYHLRLSGNKTGVLRVIKALGP